MYISGLGFRKPLAFMFFFPFFFRFMFFFKKNIVLTWKIVGVSKVSVIYIYINKNKYFFYI